MILFLPSLSPVKGVGSASMVRFIRVSIIMLVPQ